MELVPGQLESALLPLAWCIERGPMRSFYTVLGHFVGAYEDQRYLEHLSGAVRWILGGASGTDHVSRLKFGPAL